MAKIIGRPALPNMPWQDKPAGYTKPVWRYTENPIIPRDAIPTSNSVFNSAVVVYEDGYAGVFRCDKPRRGDGHFRRVLQGRHPLGHQPRAHRL